MYNARVSKLYKNKAFGAFMLIIGIFGILIILHRLSYYVYEFDAEYYPVDYGRFNVLSFFTVQSNIFTSVYLIVKAAAVFGSGRARKFAFDPTVTLFVTTYILLTGIVYCSGIALGMTPPFKWDNPNHFMLSFIQVFHHMIIPPLMLILFLFPASDRAVKKRSVILSGIYPLVYSLFSIARGALGKMHFYPYPFYRPEFFYEMIFKGREMNTAAAYILMIPALAAGVGIFIGVAALLRLVYNKRIKSAEFE